MKILQLQLHVHEDKKKNMEQLARYMEEVRGENAGLIMVGEMFNCPYQTEYFPRYAEKEGGECWQMLSALARKHQVYLAAGSMPESDDAGNVYNTAYVFDRQGRQIAKHRKVHLFDVDIEGGQYFRESVPGTEPRDGTPGCEAYSGAGSLQHDYRTCPLGTALPRPGSGQPVFLCRDVRRKGCRERIHCLGAQHPHLSLG